MIEEDIFDLVCCPNCQGDLSRIDGCRDDRSILCDSCNSSFKEKNGILILISKQLEDELRS